MGYPVSRGNTSTSLQFLMVLSVDHVTGATGKLPTVELKKNGETAFAPAVGAVTEVGNGWYQVAASALDTNVLGPMLLHATASACDPRDDTFTVVNYRPASLPAL